jgi:arsenite methyltransferase
VDDAAAADLFDGATAQYDTDVLHSTVAQALIDGLADVASPRLVLDVATGTGVAAFAELRLYPERILAVDISPGMITRAKEKATKFDPDNVITWKLAPAVPASVESEGCDVVVCASSLHFLGMDALRDWLRVSARRINDAGQNSRSVFLVDGTKPA